MGNQSQNPGKLPIHSGHTLPPIRLLRCNTSFSLDSNLLSRAASLSSCDIEVRRLLPLSSQEVCAPERPQQRASSRTGNLLMLMLLFCVKYVLTQNALLENGNKKRSLGGYKTNKRGSLRRLQNTIKCSNICQYLGTKNQQILRLDNTHATQDELTLLQGKRGLFMGRGGNHSGGSQVPETRGKRELQNKTGSERLPTVQYRLWERIDVCGRLCTFLVG